MVLRCPLLLAGAILAQPQSIVLDSGLPGPKVLVVGGIHGNEPSGVLAAKVLAGGPKPKRGVLTVISEANPQAIAVQERTAPRHADGTPGRDLNRVFPGGSEDRQAAMIYAVAVGSDLVLDLHEEGSAWREADLPTLVISPAAAAFSMELLETLNTATPHFAFTGGAPAGSLVGALGAANRQALVVEAPARLPLQERVALHGRVIDAVLGLLGMR